MSTPTKFDLVEDFIQAGFPGLWVLTQEPEAAQAALYGRLTSPESSVQSVSFAAWDVARGLRELAAEQHTGGGTDEKSRVPLYPLSPGVAAHRDEEDRRVICLHNFHRFLEAPSVVQALYNALVDGEGLGTHYVVFSPSLKIPAELEKAFTVFEFPLPTPEDIAREAAAILQAGRPGDSDGDGGLEMPVVDPAVVEAARGLTRREVRNVLALSQYQEGRLDPKVVWGLKAEAVEKSGVLTLLKGNEDTFGGIAGLEGAKRLIKGLCTYRPEVGEHAKGILLTGPPGVGKSLICRAMGAETGRPVLRLDIGSLMDKHVGESEARLRAALAVASAIAPCIVQVEELEKAMAGSGGDGDSGVMRRMLGHLLTFMEERTAPIFIAASSNDLSKLPAEFLRAGRWSCEMFVDLPTEDERADIWTMYLKRYGLPSGLPTSVLDNDDGWTGGEIKQACYLAAQLRISVKEAAKKVRITARSRASLIEDLRKNAADAQMLSATTGEPYVLPGVNSGSSDGGLKSPAGSGVRRQVGSKVNKEKT